MMWIHPIIPIHPYLFLFSCILGSCMLGVITSLLSHSNHTKNVAILVQSSPYFHNYRHSSNVLSIYQALKRFGNFTDDRIILMMAEEIPFNARNARKGTMTSLYHTHIQNPHPESFMVTDLWDPTVEIDYVGSDVSVESWFRLLLGDPPTSPEDGHSHRFLPTMDEHTNVFIYLTGHGGDTFFKFRDYEELRTQDIIHTMDRMKQLKRFHEILFIADTCQAYTLSPNYPGVWNGNQNNMVENVYSIASSLKGQYSYSHHADAEVGVSVVDRFSFEFVQFMNQRMRWKNMHRISLKSAFVDSMYAHYGGSITGADVGWDDVGCERKMDQVPMSDFLVMRTPKENFVPLNFLD
jgi:phosphatidylinositol glycan class K